MDSKTTLLVQGPATLSVSSPQQHAIREPYKVQKIITILTATLLAAASTPADSSAAPSPARPWWDAYPRIVQGGPNLLSKYHADVVFSGGLNAPS